MNVRSSLRLAPLICIAILTSSCAAPTRKFVRTSPGYDDALHETGSIGIFADVCLERDVLKGADYISIGESRTAAGYMLESASAFLQSKGYQVSIQLSPFVGSFKSVSLTFKTAEQKGGQVSSQSPPFYVSDAMARDDTLGQAVSRVIRRTLAALQQKSEPPFEVFLQDDRIPENLKTIKSRMQVDRLLVIIGSGRKTSGTKSGLQGCGTALGSLICSGGMFMISAHEVSALDTFMAFVNLDDGRILWSNDLRLEKGDPTERGYYNRWAKTLLYHLPEKGGAD